MLDEPFLVVQNGFCGSGRIFVKLGRDFGFLIQNVWDVLSCLTVSVAGNSLENKNLFCYRLRRWNMNLPPIVGLNETRICEQISEKK